MIDADPITQPDGDELVAADDPRLDPTSRYDLIFQRRFLCLLDSVRAEGAAAVAAAQGEAR